MARTCIDPAAPARQAVSILLTASGLYALLAWFCAMTPMILDDYIFSLGTGQLYPDIISGAPVMAQEKAGLADVGIRAWQMYWTWDGRFTSYLFYGLFLYLPKIAYVLCTPFLVLGTALCMFLHLFGPRWRTELTALRLLGLTALLFVTLPSFGSIYFWRTGLAFGATLCLALAFLLPYRFRLEAPGQGRRHSLPVVAAFGLFGLFTGMLEYNTPIICSLLSIAGCIYFYRESRKAGNPEANLALYLAGALGICLGCLIVFFAPGNAQRMLIATPEFLQLSLGEKIREFLLRQPKVQSLFIVPYALLLWSLWVLIRAFGRAFWQHLPKVCLLAFLSALLAQAAYLFAPHPPLRAYSGIAVFLSISALAAYWAALPAARPMAGKTLRAGQVLFALFCAALLAQELLTFNTVHRLVQAREALYSRSAGQDVRVPPLPVYGDPYMVLGTKLQDLSLNPRDWCNQAVAVYWKLNSAAFSPSPERRFEAEGIGARLRGNVLEVFLPGGGEPAKEIHVYYRGRPALLGLFPGTRAANVMGRWLMSGNWGKYLTPLFYARATAPAHWPASEKAPGRAEIDLGGLYPNHDFFYLVRPGKAWYSTDLLPLREVTE